MPLFFRGETLDVHGKCLTERADMKVTRGKGYQFVSFRQFKTINWL